MTPLLLSTILVDPQTSLLAGSIIPLVAMKLIRREPQKEYGRALMMGASWGLVYGLAVSAAYFKLSDWMFGYTVDTTTFPVVALWPLFLGANVLSGVAGAAATATAIRSGKIWVAGLCVIGALCCLLTVWLPHMDGYSHIGTFAEYRAGTAAKFPGPPDAQSVLNLATGIMVVFSVGLIAWIVRRSLKPVASQA